jgi:hypothetical protein
LDHAPSEVRNIFRLAETTVKEFGPARFTFAQVAAGLVKG